MRVVRGSKISLDKIKKGVVKMENAKMQKKLNSCLEQMGINNDDEYDIDNGIDITAREVMDSVIMGFSHKIIDVDYFLSGGGFRHLMCQLESGHIITFHNCEDDIELSYNRWESIEAYYDVETSLKNKDLVLVDYECGFGFEHKYPNYELRGTNLKTAYSSKVDWFKKIELACSDDFWTPHSAIHESLDYWGNQHEVVTSNIVSDWFQHFEESNEEMTNEYNESMHEISSWRKKKEKLDRVVKAKKECEGLFQDCIEYTNPTIREAFKSRGFVDGTWKNSISPSFELWLDEESPISNNVLFVVYFPNLTEEDNPSELQDEQFNDYSIELMVNGDNVLEDVICFDNYYDALGFFYSNTKIANYTLQIDKEVK